MAQAISRRKLAAFVADGVTRGDDISDLLESLAAYLIDTRRTREADLVVRTIEDELEARGTTIATVVSARGLDADMRDAIGRLLDARTLEVREVIDPSVLGGVRVDTPSTRLDATIKHRLAVLRDRAKQ